MGLFPYLGLGPRRLRRLDVRCLQRDGLGLQAVHGRIGRVLPQGEPWLTAAIPMENTYCSCKLTRSGTAATSRTATWRPPAAPSTSPAWRRSPTPAAGPAPLGRPRTASLQPARSATPRTTPPPRLAPQMPAPGWRPRPMARSGHATRVSDGALCPPAKSPFWRRRSLDRAGC